MKYTLSDCISTINQILNYPSIAYEDVSVFLDQAIAELNTTLHIQIKPISYLRKYYTNTVKLEPIVLLNNMPTSSDLIPTTETVNGKYYYDGTEYKVKTVSGWKGYDKLYGVYHDPFLGSKYFKAVKLTPTDILWGQVDVTNPNNYDLTEILPVDWITLYLIPYVCFKQSVRDGSNGTLYSEEFTQGFQQLQNSYDVPSNVTLSTVVHLPAYKEDVLDNLANLGISISTRAITQNMLHDRVVKPEYGTVYDRGGWGI